MIPHVVLDTNVILDLHFWRDPRVAPLLAAAQAGAIRLLTDQRCADELIHVLGRTPFGGSEAAAREIAGEYLATAAMVEPAGPAENLAALPRCRDPDDQKFLELAVRASADLLVTRDKALLALARKKCGLAPLRIVAPEPAIALLGLARPG